MSDAYKEVIPLFWAIFLGFYNALVEGYINGILWNFHKVIARG